MPHRNRNLSFQQSPADRDVLAGQRRPLVQDLPVGAHPQAAQIQRFQLAEMFQHLIGVEQTADDDQHVLPRFQLPAYDLKARLLPNNIVTVTFIKNFQNSNYLRLISL